MKYLILFSIISFSVFSLESIPCDFSTFSQNIKEYISDNDEILAKDSKLASFSYCDNGISSLLRTKREDEYVKNKLLEWKENDTDKKISSEVNKKLEDYLVQKYYEKKIGSVCNPKIKFSNISKIFSEETGLEKISSTRASEIRSKFNIRKNGFYSFGERQFRYLSGKRIGEEGLFSVQDKNDILNPIDFAKKQYEFGVMILKGICKSADKEENFRESISTHSKKNINGCFIEISVNYENNDFEATNLESNSEYKELQSCIEDRKKKIAKDPDLKLNKIKMRSIGTANGLRNTKNYGDYIKENPGHEVFLRKNIEGFYNTEEQKKIYPTYKDISKLRAAYLAKEIQGKMSFDENKTEIEIVGQGQVGPCPYSEEKLLPEYMSSKAKDNLEKYNTVKIYVDFDVESHAKDKKAFKFTKSLSCKIPYFVCAE